MGRELHPIALYPFQFHSILENDKCWGRHFNEWPNATKAKSLITGRYHLNLSADNKAYAHHLGCRSK